MCAGHRGSEYPAGISMTLGVCLTKSMHPHLAAFPMCDLRPSDPSFRRKATLFESE